MKIYDLTNEQRQALLSDATLGNGTFSVSFSIDLGKVHDENLIIKTMEELVKKTDTLRVKLVEKHQKVMQCIADTYDYNFEILHFNCQRNLEEWKKKYVISPMDISKSLCQLIGYELGGSYSIFVTMHHIICDAWSCNLLIERIRKIYTALLLKQNIDLDYYLYEKYLSEYDVENVSDRNACAEYWKDINSINTTCIDFSTKNAVTNMANKRSVKIDKETSRQINKFAREKKISLFLMYITAIGELSKIIYGKVDFFIGTSLVSRLKKYEKEVIGMLVNTVPLYMKVQNCGLEESFINNKKNLYLAFKYQKYNYTNFLNKLSKKNNANKLYSIVINHQIAMGGVVKCTEVEWIHRNMQNESLIIDLFEDENEEINVIYSYLETKYDEWEIELLNNRIFLLIDSWINNKKVDLDREIILYQFNAIREIHRKKTIVDLFEEQIEKNPELTALVYGDKTMTYRELNEKANALGHRLRRMGVCPDSFVAVMTERSMEMIAGIFGVLKAGGAYVPVDSEYPEERIRYMLEDCRPKALLIYGKEAKEKAKKVTGEIPVIDLAESEVWEGAPENLKKVNKDSDLCYCIYTSGTTGKPKGVLLEHKGVVSMEEYFVNKLGITNRDNILQFANLTFDASVWEIMMALLNGAALHIVSKEMLLHTREMGKYLSEKIDVATLPPQYAVQLDIRNMRILITAGSEANPTLYNTNEGISRFINAYGPTEGTVCATTWTYERGWNGKVPIGKPIPNVQIYIMRDGQLCGIGMPGEICIAGAGVARGYLNNPELTNEKFTENPYGKGKMYHSGDLGRWLPDGNIEFMGRIDEQVKIRGFRVELGEIENAIRKQEGVRDVAVTVREEEGDGKAVCAYIVGEKTVDMEQIRSSLRKELPSYMIPSYMMQIGEIPLTKNGKLDKKSLPEIEAEGKAEYEAPKTMEEELLCKAFGEVLGADRAGIHDGFFELGGDSIKAMRITSFMRNRGYELTVKDIMEKQTVREMALSVRRTEINTYEQGEVSGEVMDTPIIRAFRGWKFKEPWHFNQALMLQVENCEESEIKEALEAVVKHHDMLRGIYKGEKLYIRKEGEGELLEFSSYGFSEMSEMEQKGGEICRAVQQSMNLEQGPLVKAVLLSTEKEKNLMICIHHLLVDGVSWRIILEDLKKAVEQKHAGEAIRLPEKTASYREWAEALEEYRKVGISRKEAEYWERKREEIKDSHLKTSAKGEMRTETLKLTVGRETTEKLLYQAGEAYHTQINDLLLGALGMAVGKLTGQEKVAVNMEGHGREPIHKRMDVDRTVGWFTNMYPVILECGRNVEDAIVSTKEMFRRIPNHGLGYWLTGEETDSGADIAFNYLGEGEKWDGISMEVEDSSSKVNCFLPAINFNGIMEKRELHFWIVYDAGRQAEGQIRKLAEYYKESLEEIVEHCAGIKDSVMTLSDTHAGELDDFDLNLLNELYGTDN